MGINCEWSASHVCAWARLPFLSGISSANTSALCFLEKWKSSVPSRTDRRSQWPLKWTHRMSPRGRWEPSLSGWCYSPCRRGNHPADRENFLWSSTHGDCDSENMRAQWERFPWLDDRTHSHCAGNRGQPGKNKHLRQRYDPAQSTWSTNTQNNQLCVTIHKSTRNDERQKQNTEFNVSVRPGVARVFWRVAREFV